MDRYVDGWIDGADKRMMTLKMLSRFLWPFSLVKDLLKRLFSLWRLLLWKENCHCLRTPTLPCFFFQNCSQLCFQPFSDSLWYMYRLNFQSEFGNNWLIKIKDSNCIWKSRHQMLLWEKLNWRMWYGYIMAVGFIPITYCCITTIKLEDLKQQQSFILLMSLQLGQG